MSGRTIVIGDVHGCLRELRELLAAVEARPEDRLISVGDLICKGPDSRKVLDWAMATPNLECVLGNHELRFLERWRGEDVAAKPYDGEVYAQLGEDLDRYMRFIESWPLTIPGPGFMVVHAGFDPRRPLDEQTPRELTGLRRLKDTGEPWFLRYEDSRLIVFGHWAQRSPIVRSNAVGLDTGCVYGAALTGLLLPERRLLSVRARRAYSVKETWDEALLGSAGPTPSVF